MLLKYVELLKVYYKGSVSQVRVYEEETEAFPAEFWVNNGYVLSLTLFNYCIDLVLENALSSHPGVQIGLNLSLGDYEYAYDVAIFSDPEKAQIMLDGVVTWAYHVGLKVSTGKTKFMAVNHTDPISLIVNQVQLGQFNSFKYLGF